MNPAPSAPIPFRQDDFLTALAPVLSDLLGGDGRAEVVDQVSGNINLVLKLSYRGRSLGARVALNTHRFRYERDIIKEVFAVLLLSYGSGRIDDGRLRQIVDALLHRPSGSHINHQWVRPVLWYDWSLSVLPYPFFIFEWIEGRPLWTCPEPKLYARAGEELAKLHRLVFEHFYEDVFAIDRDRLEWPSRFGAAWSREVAEAVPALPPTVARALESFRTDGIAPGIPCLVHNDYTGGNLLVEPGGELRMIDWDNWVVECPELDLVKMKYWTAIGSSGLLGPDKALFEAFRAGYDRQAARPIDDERLKAYERLWLMRVFNFERTRGETEPVSWQAVYPPAEAYGRLLQEFA